MSKKYDVFETFRRQKDMDNYELMTKIAEFDTFEEAVRDVNRRIHAYPNRRKAELEIFTSINSDGSVGANMTALIKADPIVSYGWIIQPCENNEYKIGQIIKTDNMKLDDDGRWPNDAVNHIAEEEEELFE